MAAPKTWGYSREQAFGDEMLVSWADGDLTAILTKEVVERLLHRREERERVAAWARAAQRSSHTRGKDWIQNPPKPLVEACKSL